MGTQVQAQAKRAPLSMKAALFAVPVALLFALSLVFASATPAYAADTYKQTTLGNQVKTIQLKKGAVKLNVVAGASSSSVGIYASVDEYGNGSGSVVSTYVDDPYGKMTRYGNIAKSGTYYLVFYASTYSGAVGTKATVTSYPYKSKTAKVGKTLTVSTCGDNSTVARYKLNVEKRGLLAIKASDATGNTNSINLKLCNEKKKSLQGDSWTYVKSGEMCYYGVNPGTYYLTVKSYASVFKIQPKLIAAKAGGTKQAKAIPIAQGKAVKGVLAVGEKARWYKFTVKNAKKYTIYLNGKVDTNGLKFTFSGENYYDANAYLWNSQPKETVKTNKLKKGTYYIKVQPGYSSSSLGSGWFSIKWQ